MEILVIIDYNKKVKCHNPEIKMLKPVSRTDFKPKVLAQIVKNSVSKINVG